MRLSIDVRRANRDVSVAELAESDLVSLFEALDDGRVWEHMPGRRPATPAELSARLLRPGRRPMLIRRSGVVVGTSSYLDVDDEDAVEIGATCLSPKVWGTGLNLQAKDVMLMAAFAAGAKWVQLRTDERNLRSAGAILKLPGVIEVDPRPELGVIRPDGTQRTSRVFRVMPTIGARDFG